MFLHAVLEETPRYEKKLSLFMHKNNNMNVAEGAFLCVFSELTQSWTWLCLLLLMLADLSFNDRVCFCSSEHDVFPLMSIRCI